MIFCQFSVQLGFSLGFVELIFCYLTEMFKAPSKKEATAKTSHKACHLPIVNPVRSKIPVIRKNKNFPAPAVVAKEVQGVPNVSNVPNVPTVPNDIGELKESLIELKQDHKGTSDIVCELKENFDKFAVQFCPSFKGKIVVVNKRFL